MKTYLILLLLATLVRPVIAQQRRHYTLWADGLVNAQLAKSNLYALVGTGLRGEMGLLNHSGRGMLIAQAGYGYFFQKNTGAFTAHIGLVNLGYRYLSRRSFNASVGVGAQYWREQMRLRLANNDLAETFHSVLPGATVNIGFGGWSHYRVGLENRLLFRPAGGSFRLLNNVALSVGYTF